MIEENNEENDIKTYVNHDAFNFGIPNWYGGPVKWAFEDGTEIIFDFNQECDNHVEYSVKHDGTLLFVIECFERCLSKMMYEAGHELGDKYIVGKIIRTEEFDMDGTKFAPKDKPWCSDRTTYKIDYRKENRCK